jgi:hypothetical protein
MSKSSRTSTASPTTAQTFNPDLGVHKPFTWVHGKAKDFPTADFIGTVLDITSGIEACLQIVNSSSLDRMHNEGNDLSNPPSALLSVCDESRLLRFAMSASMLLCEAAEHKIDWINEHGVAYLDRVKGQP